ncbi:MAG: helix-turn-helix transcriptional regulator [Clostridia bacterium]|nr:helix-turn-helix transcriptional regulator [Clostridia bacterium]
MPLVYYPECSREAVLPVYLTGVGTDYKQESVARPTLTDPQILISAAGTGYVTVGEETFELPAGTGFYLGRGVDYHYRPKAGSDWRVDWVTFVISSDELRGALFTAQDYAQLRIQNPDAVHKTFRQLFDTVSLDREYGAFTASAMLYSMLIEFNRSVSDIPAMPTCKSPAIQSVLDYIEAHYAEEIALEDLCSAAGGLSEQYLCRLFKASVGLRPIEYILRKRIDIARSYLDKTDLPITDIAVKCGFNNTSYFYRNFKKFTGTSPLTYRAAALKDQG